jgi:CheY-like chemotaxis protein/nitrogen-specific signal transduction histidine kinase
MSDDERMKLLDELEKAKKKLKEYEEEVAKAEKASQMKSLFLANMSHEIRTPLNAIEGFSRIIAITDSPEDRAKYLDIIESNNNRLIDLVNEILDLSRVESGEFTVHTNPTDLNLMCKEIIDVFRFRCSNCVNLTWDKNEKNVYMLTDKNRLMQVFSNLISNAIKSTPKGDINFGYHLLNNKTVEFYVKDTGVGIKKGDIDKIFLTYVTNHENSGGFGLGLPLSKIIVKRLGGKIGVTSEVGRGSTFTFILPFEEAISSIKTEHTTARSLRPKEVNGIEKKLILVAEDSQNNYDLVKAVLNKQYNLIHAKDGIEAVTLNEEERPDLILMDVKMPNMDGLDATKIIKEVSPKTPIIALSAYAFEEDIKKTQEVGCDCFIAKPFHIEDLLSIIEKFLAEK